MDNISRRKRSKIMRSIKSENTKPEKAVRSCLYKMGYRFRLHERDLPGTPDIVLHKYGTVIFVNGCFWHQHGCERTSMPKSNEKFWTDKMKNNKERDRRNKKLLEDMGWKVIVAWECDIAENPQGVAERIAGELIKRKDQKIRIIKSEKTKKQKRKDNKRPHPGKKRRKRKSPDSR